MLFLLISHKCIVANPMSGGYPPLVDTYKMLKSRESQKKDLNADEKITQIQSFFIQKIFLKPFFELQKQSMFSKDDDTTGLMPQEFGLTQEIIMQEFANELAKRDIFKLKKVLKKDYERFLKKKGNQKKYAGQSKKRY
jgi:hypothetical protein